MASDKETKERASDLLDRIEAAELANVHVNTIRNWSRDGFLPEQRVLVGNREVVRLRRADVERVVRERPVGGTGSRERAVVLDAPTLWAIVQDSIREATEARERASAAEAEVKVLRAELRALRDVLKGRRR